MNPYCLLDRLVDFEQRASRVYLTLSGRLDFSPHLQAFWKRLAEDEREHADIMGRSLTQLEVRECSPATSENALTILEAKVGAAEATVRQSGLGSDEAFRLTLMLEEAELNSLDEAWFQGFYSTRGSLLQVMLPEEESHIRHVVDAVRAFSTDERLQRQVAALWSTYERQRRRHSQAQTPNAGSDTSKGKDL
jgi:rubrerythrin